MRQENNTAGICNYDDFRLEYHVVVLEYVPCKQLNIEVVCYNPAGTWEKEATFKHSTKLSPFQSLELIKFQTSDPKLRIAASIISSVIENIKLPKDKLRRLNIKDGKVWFVCVV
jgi:hypothetical protein